MSGAHAAQCPNGVLADLIAAIQRQPENALTRVEAVAAEFPGDGRLRFLYGSMLASAKRYEEAHQEMREATRLAPYFWIARFQLGLLELTSGDPTAAATTWEPMSDLADSDALKTFVRGLHALIADRMDEAVGLLKLGIERNSQFPPLNRDMQLMIDRILSLDPSGNATAEEPSAVELLLSQYRADRTRH